MRLSWLGLLLGVSYLGPVSVQMFRVLSRRSFGGIFSQEFALFVLTLPASPLGELLFKRSDVGRVCIYILSALLNAAALYFLGMGLSWIAHRVFPG